MPERDQRAGNRPSGALPRVDDWRWRRHLRAERAPHTLQATALVHEVYLKLLQGSQRGFSDRLAEQDQHLAHLIQMRYFRSMTAEESAEALGASVHTVRRDIRLALTWLRENSTARIVTVSSD